MAYPIKNNTVYNMVLLHPEKPHAPNKSSWTSKGSKTEMMEFYNDWSPLVRNLLSYVPDGEVLEWTLNSHRPLPSWIENKVALMGDACHPMLPYVAQGAANAIEDAGVLACALSLGGKSSDGIDAALAVYQHVRKERAEKIQNSASTTRKALHLPDGSEQRERDRAIAEASPRAKTAGASSSKGSASSGQSKHNPDLWADAEWQQFMWGTDVMKDTVDGWDHLRARVRGHHAGTVPAAG
jgi:salicylate hydroxylase